MKSPLNTDNDRITYIRRIWGIKGIGNPEIGMLFVSEEGSELTDPMMDRFRSNMWNGIIVVVDRYEQSFAFYRVDGDCRRTAKALLSE